MHRFCTILILSALLGVAMMNFSSCEKYILPEIILTPDTLAIDDSARVLNVRVTSNVKWQAEVPVSDTSWLYATPKTKIKGDSTIIISVKANESQEPREGSVSVTSETLKKFIVITQDGVR